MKRALWITILSVSAVIAFTYVRAAPLSIDDLILTADDVKPGCEPIDGEYAVRNETHIFYQHGVNSELIPLVLNKRLQSFRCGKQKGTLYFFEYNDIPAREQAEIYARTTLWGGNKAPTPQYPEQIFHSDRFLMILSFKDSKRELLGALLKHVKGPSAAVPSK